MSLAGSALRRYGGLNCCLYRKFSATETDNDRKIKSFIQRVKELNFCSTPSIFLPLKINGLTYGYLPRKLEILLLTKFSDKFMLVKDSTSENLVLTLSPIVYAMSLWDRTAAIANVTGELRRMGLINGWRDELLPVTDSFSNNPAFLIERAAIHLFGMKAYGIHVNGIVRDTTTGNVTKLWVGKRSSTKATFPGMFDHIVAGGLPYGINPINNVIKECSEEANIPAKLACRAQAVGAVSYSNIDEEGRLDRNIHPSTN